MTLGKINQGNSKKGQTWSTDLIIGVVIFLLIITIFYTLGSRNQGTKIERLQRQGEAIAADLDTNIGGAIYPVIKNGVIEDSEITVLYNRTYDEMLSDFGTSARFCIYLEDQDGKIIILDNKTGTGNAELKVAGTGCGQSIT